MAFNYDNNLHVQNPGRFPASGSCNALPYQYFMGADIKGFTLNLGYGQSETVMQLDLVESVAPPAEDQTFGCEVPGYSGVLGNVYTIRIFDINGNSVFDFSGILLDHDINIDGNGKTISARLSDGRQYLDNVTIIANKYYSRNFLYNEDGTSQNILNVLYEAEPGVARQFDQVGGISTSKCNDFMDSGSDKDGIPAIYILGQFIASNRYLTLPLTNQTLRINIEDIYNAALARATKLRITDTSISLLNLIDNVCNEMGYDFFVYIVNTFSGYEIIVKGVNKSVPISGFSLRDELENYTNNSNFSTLSYGQETSYDPTRNIVIGDHYRYFVEIERDVQYNIFNSEWKNGFGISSSLTSSDYPDNITTIVDTNTPIRSLDYTSAPVNSCYNQAQWNTEGLCSCATPNGGGRIFMLLGETLNGVNADGIPTHKLYLSNLCGDYINVQYNVNELCSILGVSCPGATARLTEEELLFTETYESYMNWSLAHPGSIGYTFGQAIFGTGLWGNFQKVSLKIFADIVDNGSFDSFKDPSIAYPDAQVSNKKFEIVHQYVKRIYDSYYGSEYVVLLDKKNTNTLNDFDVCLGKSYNMWPTIDPSNPTTSTSSISIPVNDGNDLAYNGVINNVIKTAGRNGYISATDTIANGAWFAGPTNDAANILGLTTVNGLSIFLNDDNTIGGFVKYGPIENICKRIGNKTFCFRVDFSEMDPSDFFVDGSNNLYLKAQFSEEMYFGKLENMPLVAGLSDDDTFVRFSLPRVKLVPDIATSDAVGIASSRLALIALQTMTDLATLSGILASGSGNITLADAIKDKLAGGGINPGIWDGIASNLAITNLAKISTPATVPLGVAIPFESQTITYGPWHYVVNPSGGTRFIEYDLNPWSFGFGSTAAVDGWVRMNTAGVLLATNGVNGRTFQEKGSVTYIGIPNINIGNFASNSSSAVLTDINFSFGADGAKTKLTYQTYTPKFGSTPKYLIDTAKETIAHKLDYMRQFREAGIKNRASFLKLREDLIKLNYGRKSAGGGGVENSYDNSKYKASPSKFLFGGYFNKNDPSDINNAGGGQDDSSSSFTTHNYENDLCADIDNAPFPANSKPITNSNGNTLRRFVSEEIHPTYNFDYAQKQYYKNASLMSLDGLFLPISINGGPSYNLARYASYMDSGNLPSSRPINAMPPVNFSSIDEELNSSSATAFNLKINGTYLNPIVSKAILDTWDDRGNNSTQGFVIVNIGQGSSVEENFNFDDIKNTDGSIDTDRQNYTDFRFHAIRGPLVLQSWGYDINGKPIPNANDSAADAEIGRFRHTFLKDKFLKNWLGNPKTWPVGPVDLRWDRNRGVWVSPPASKLIVARLKETLNPYGSAEAELLNPESGGIEYYANYDLYGPEGENIKSDVRNCTVTVHDYLGMTVSKCAMVLLHYEDGKYIIIEEGGNRLQRARITQGDTLTCNGTCDGELFIIAEGGGYEYGDPGSIKIADTMGLVAQPLSSLTRLWVMKMPDSGKYEVVYIGNREDANCGSCGGFGVYSIAGVDFNRLNTAVKVGKVLTVSPGGCLELVDTTLCQPLLDEGQ